MLKDNPCLSLLLSYLTSIEEETYLVGGAVRNYLLGLEYQDIDIVTKMKPQQVIDSFKDLEIDTKGVTFGNVKIYFDERWISITTFRKDFYKHHNRYPYKVEFVDTLEEDLMRRDFRVNTICYHQNRGIVDLLDGQKDLDCMLLTTVQDSVQSVQEDPLRMFRALRFCCQYNFDLSHELLVAIRNHHKLIQTISLNLTNEEKRLMKQGKYFSEKRKQYPNLFKIIYI